MNLVLSLFNGRGLVWSVLILLCVSVKAEEFTSPLPLFYIATEEPVNADEKVPGTMRIIVPGADGLSHGNDSVCDYNGNIGIKWRGNSSLSFDQKKYTLETRDSLGNDLKVSVLGMPEESDWVLLAPYNDISLLRDVFAFDLWNEMGHWGPRTRMCEVFVNNEYMGVYVFCESIKRDKNRVDIAKLKEDDLSGRDLTGGYIVRVDAFDENDATFVSSIDGIQPSMWGTDGKAKITWTVYYPKKADLQADQMRYIQSFVDDMERSFQTDDYEDWIDVSSFVDYFIHTELSMNADGFKRSSYFFRDKDKKDGTKAKMHAGPVWDYNLAYGNCNFCNANNPNAWVYEGCYTNPTPAFWKKLAEDPTFMAAVENRYAALRATILSHDRINDFFDTFAALLDEPKDRHYAKYDNLFSSGSGSYNPWSWNWNPNPISMYAAYLVSSYEEEISTIKAWFEKRMSFLDTQWHYDPASVPNSDGFFSVDFFLADNGQLIVKSDRELVLVEIHSLDGRLLDSVSGQRTDYSVSLPSKDVMKIVSCYASDGSYISYRIK